MKWLDIEKRLTTIEKAKDGFTLAHRGVVTMPDGSRVFVKIGIDDDTSNWIRKEIAVYEFLAGCGFAYIPKLLAHNADKTGLAIEALMPESGWDWTNTWTRSRLRHTLVAMDALAELKPSHDEGKIFRTKMISEDSDGWRQLVSSGSKQSILKEKLRSFGHVHLAKTMQVDAMAAQSSSFIFDYTSLVHNDLRADNCAWNARQSMPKLIDWNWAQFGDRRIDINAMLVHVYKSGLDVLEDATDRLDPDALHWLAGFWFNHAASPELPGGDSQAVSLRDRQLASGVLALKLREQLLQGSKKAGVTP